MTLFPMTQLTGAGTSMAPALMAMGAACFLLPIVGAITRRVINIFKAS